MSNVVTRDFSKFNLELADIFPSVDEFTEKLNGLELSQDKRDELISYHKMYLDRLNKESIENMQLTIDTINNLAYTFKAKLDNKL